MIPEAKVKLLIDRMNSMSSAAIPAQKPIIEMFNIAMDEKMVDYLLKIGTEYHTVEQLKEVYHEMYGGDDAEWDAHWTEVIGMSLVHPKSNEERHLYGLSPIFPGWVEFYTSGPANEKRKAVLNKFMEFWGVLKEMNKFPFAFLNDYKTGKLMKKGIPPRVSTYLSTGKEKEVTLNQPLEAQQEIHPAGDIFKLLEKNKDEIAVMNCFCRSYKKMSKGEDCEHGLPVEGCISLGALARQVIDNGVARHVPYEEALTMMNEFEKKGCIHTAFHYKNDASLDAIVVCNCCPDCCLLYSGWKQGGLSKVFARSYYKPQMIDEKRCVGCNLCGVHCPTEATYYDKQAKKLVFDYSKCVGCGQCVTQCKFNVREMVKDERDVFVKTKKKSQVK